MSSFVKSHIRASIFPSPLNKAGCIAWGSCGILALGAKSTVLLYRCSPNSIVFLRAIEIPDGSNPIQLDFPNINTIMNSNITKNDNQFTSQTQGPNAGLNNKTSANQAYLECDDFSRYLAIATDSVSFYIFDCISGIFCASFSKSSSSSTNVNPRYSNVFKNAFSSKSTIHSIKWIKQYLIFLTSSNSPSTSNQPNSISVTNSYLSVIDFFGDSDLSLNKESGQLNDNQIVKEESTRRSSFHGNTDNQNKNKSRARVLWSIELREFYDNIVIDPFSMNGTDKNLNNACCFSPISHFRCLLYSSKTNIFNTIESHSPSEAPISLSLAQSMSGVSFITDACFHPQLQNVLVILYSTSAVFYDLNSKAIKSVIAEIGPEMERIFLSESNSNELIIYCRDNSFILFKQKEKTRLKSKSNLSSKINAHSNSLDFEMSLDFDKVSVTQMKREVVANQSTFLITKNPLFDDCIVCCSVKYGLFLLQLMKNKKIIVTKNHAFAPMRYSAFDSNDKLTVLGTENGSIMVINNIDGSIAHSFTVNSYEYTNSNSSSNKGSRVRSSSTFVTSSNDIAPPSPSSQTLNPSSSGMISSANSIFSPNLANPDEIVNIKLVTPNIVYWSTSDRFGGIDLSNSTIYFYENRFFSSFVQLPVASSDEIIVVKRDRYAIGVNRIENLVFDVNNFFQSQTPNPFLASSFLEKPISFNSEVIAFCVQQKSSPATITKFGDHPAFAVLLRNSQIHFFNSIPSSSLTTRRGSEIDINNMSSDPVMRLRCEKLSQPVSIAWKQSVFVTCDWNGKFIFFDFEYPNTFKSASSPFGNIKRVDFDKSENGLFIHSQVDCKLGFYANEKVDVCKSTQVYDFSSTGGGLVTVMTPTRVVKILCLNRDWAPIIEIAQQSVTKPLLTVRDRYHSIIETVDSITNLKSDVIKDKLPIELKVDYVLWKSKMLGLSYPAKLFMIIKKFLNGLNNALKENKTAADFLMQNEGDKKESEVKNDDLSVFVDEVLSNEFDNYFLPPRYSYFSSTSDEIQQSNIFKANLISNVQSPDFFDNVDPSLSQFNSNMESNMNLQRRSSMNSSMNSSLSGVSNEVSNDNMNSNMLSFVSHTRSIIERALLNVQVGKIEEARDTFLSFSSATPIYPICALAASLLGSNICETGVGVLKGASISLFDSNDVNAALLILSIAKLDTFAAQILQERELYDESVAVLRLSCFAKSSISNISNIQNQKENENQSDSNLDVINYYDSYIKYRQNKNQEQNQNNHQLNTFVSVRGMLRRAAHFFLDSGQYEKASLLFASLGDFHPVIAIAAARKQFFLAYLLLIVFKDSGLLEEYDIAKGHMSPQQLFDVQFDTLEFLDRHIKNKYAQSMQNNL